MDADTPPLYADNLPDMTGATVVNIGAASGPFNWTTDTQTVTAAANAKTIIRYPTTRKYMGTFSLRMQRGSIVQLIGGHCNIGLTSTGDDPQQGGSGQQSGATMFKLSETGTFTSGDVAYLFHEGTYFDGASGPVSPLFGAGNPCECDAMNVSNLHTIIWRKNVRTEGLVGDLTTGHKHADGEQTAGGYKEIHHEDCHYQSHYNNLYHRRENSPLGGVPGRLFINRVHCDSYDTNPVPGAQVGSTLRALSIGLQPDDASGGAGNDNSLENGLLTKGVWLKDFYGSPPTGRPLNQFMHPRAGGSVPTTIAPVMNADGTQAWWPQHQTLTFPPADETTPSTGSTVGSGDAEVYGVLHKGPPPSGDFAPANRIGLSYTGPFSVVESTGASFSTGFEHGTLAVFDSVTGSPSIDTTSGKVRNGARSLKTVSTPGINTANHTISGDYLSARFAFKISALPTGGSAQIFTLSTAISTFVISVGTGGSLFANVLSGGTSHGVPGTLPDTWYLVEVECDSSTQTHTMNWKLNGIAQTPATMVAASSSPLTQVSIGQGNSNSTVTTWVDDYAWTQDQSRGFLGDGKVLGFALNASGPHITPGDFQTAAGVPIATSDTTAYQLVDEIPPSLADYVKQVTASTSASLSFGVSNTTETSNPVLVTAYAGLSAGDIGPNDATVKVTTDSGLTFENVFSGSIGTTGLVIASLPMLNPTGSVGWTPTDLNALRFRFGYSADVLPQPQLHWLYVEAEFPISNVNQALSDSDAATGTDTASASATPSLTDANQSATETFVLAATSGPGADAGSSTESPSLAAAITATADAGTSSETASAGIKAVGQDSGSGSDASAQRAQLVPVDADVAVTEASALAAAFTNVETGAGTDTAKVLLVVADEGVGADVMSRVIVVSDVGSVTDVADASIGGLAFASSDAGTGTDAAVLSAAYLLPETATGSDSGQPTINVTETGTSTETATTATQPVVSDTGTSIESASVRYLATDDEVGAGAETFSIAANVSVTDTGAGVAQADLAARHSGSDASTGSTETSSLVAALTGQESGSSAESAGTSASVAGNEAGVGADDIDLFADQEADDSQVLVVTEHGKTKRKHRIYRPNTIILEPHTPTRSQ